MHPSKPDPAGLRQPDTSSGGAGAPSGRAGLDFDAAQSHPCGKSGQHVGNPRPLESGNRIVSRRLRTSSAYLRWVRSAFSVSEPVDPASVRDGWVMGLAVGYPAEALTPFVCSLRAVYTGRVTLFVSNDPDVIALLNSFEIDARVMPSWVGWRPHLVVERFAIFAQMLNQAPPSTPVLITDVRDVVFQGSIFDPPVKDLEVFAEGNGITMSEHAFNWRYGEALVGRDVSSIMDEQVPLCAGTIVGRASKVAALCRTMLFLSAIPRSGRGGAFGADQAALNVAVHFGLVEAGVQLNYGRVATLGWQDNVSAQATKDGLILNPDGSMSPIVHQYDRRSDLADAVARRWSTAPVVRLGPITWRQRKAKAVATLRKWLPELR